MMIEGLGKKFQEARIARNLTLDEASRMTKIRPSRLGEIEADDFSQFPSLAYAKGFLLIYGKFLDVDVTPYMEAFEGSDAMTVDGYSYLQDNPAPKPSRTPVVPRRPRPAQSSSPGKPGSLMPLVFAIAVVVVGYFAMRLFLNIQRIVPHRTETTAVAQASAAPVTQPSVAMAVAAPTPAPKPASTPPPAPVAAPTTRVVSAPAATAPPLAASVAPTAPAVAIAPPSATPAAAEPEVRRAEPVRPEDLVKSTAAESSGPNRVAIRPLKKTYIKVVVDEEAKSPAFERWISPADGSVEFHGQHFAVRVLDRDAVQIKKNGKPLADGDTDVTIE
jgi:cytoskeletal protein RodZ